ncbi:hypothetical protein VPH35_136415 [Triticum aestivum]|uniref:Uncharacterized protein n=1 Tax=Aegilops tauschii subsp. strangulata TaxID=200361 RepID=A0A453R9R4_AEGTS
MCFFILLQPVVPPKDASLKMVHGGSRLLVLKLNFIGRQKMATIRHPSVLALPGLNQCAFLLPVPPGRIIFMIEGLLSWPDPGNLTKADQSRRSPSVRCLCQVILLEA